MQRLNEWLSTLLQVGMLGRWLFVPPHNQWDWLADSGSPCLSLPIHGMAHHGLNTARHWRSSSAPLAHQEEQPCHA